MTLNVTSSKTSYCFTNQTDQSAETPAIVLLSEHIPREWIQAGFCNAQGILQFAANIIEEFDSKLFESVLKKKVVIDDNQIRIRTYLDRISAIFAEFSKKVYLRGSYATYLVGLEIQIKLLVNHFIKLHPDTELLMTTGLSRLNLQHPQPDDIDFAISFENPIEKADWIRDEIIQLNSELGKTTLEDARARTFANLLLPRKNIWCQLEDKIAIASLRGRVKVDFTVGHMEMAPYLFTMDNHAIVREEGKWFLESVAKTVSPWQSFVDKAFGIVRIESRHSLDFRAILRAIILLTRGAVWDTTYQVVADYMAPYLNNPMDKLLIQLTSKLEDPRVEKVSFIVNFLSLVADPKMRETIWAGLANPWFPDFPIDFEDAALQIAEQKKAFPELYGALTLLKIPADRPLPAPSLTFMKKTLFMELPLADESCSGTYAEWRRCCHKLQTKEKVPEELIKALCTMYIQGLLDDELQGNLTQLLQVSSLLEVFIGVSEDPKIIDEWLMAHAEQTWLDKLSILRRIGAGLTILKSMLNRIESKDEFILAAVQLNIFLLTLEIQTLVKEYLLTCSNKQIVQFLHKLGPKIKPEKKEWIIELWIYAFENQKLDKNVLQIEIKKWLSSALISQETKDRVALALFQRIRTTAFENIPTTDFLEFFGQATLGEKENLFVWFLEHKSSAAIRFYTIHEIELKPRLHFLFDQALNCQQGHRFIRLFYREETLQDAFYTKIDKIPEIKRLECARRFSQQRRLSLADHPDILNSVDRTSLRIDLLRETKSILLMWRWQRDKSSFPEKVINKVLTAFAETETIQVEEEDVAALFREGNFSKISMLFSKLNEEDKTSLLKYIQIEFAEAFREGNLQRIKQISSQPILMKGMPIPIDLGVNSGQLPDLLQMLKEERQPDLKSLYCATYAAFSQTAADNLEFCDHLFSLLPHFPWENHVLLFLNSVRTFPRELRGRFKSIEAELLTDVLLSGELLLDYFTFLHNAKMAIPATLPRNLVVKLTEKPELLVDSTFIFALLKNNPDPSFLQILLLKLIELNDLKSFAEWFKTGFKKLDGKTQEGVLKVVTLSPPHLESLLGASKTAPTIFGEHVDQVVQCYVNYCILQNKPCSFTTFEHLHITQLAMLFPLVGSDVLFVENATAVLRYLDSNGRSQLGKLESLDITVLLDIIIKKACLFKTFEFLEDFYDLLHEFDEVVELTPIGKELCKKQLKNGIRDPYWLSYAKTFEEIVKSLQLLKTDPKKFRDENDYEDTLHKLMERALEILAETTISPEEEDIGLFFRILAGYLLEYDCEDMLESIKEMVDSEKTLVPIRIKAALLYLIQIDDEDDIPCSLKVIEFMDSHFTVDNFKVLFLYCFKYRARFEPMKEQFSALIDKNSPSIPEPTRNFFRLLIQLTENERAATEEQLFALIPPAKSLQINLTASPLILFFAYRLMDIAANNKSDFTKKLYEYCLKLAGTIPNQPLAEAIPTTLARMVQILVIYCSVEDSVEYCNVLQGLNVFVKEKLFTIYKKDPQQIALIGKKIIFSAFIHPRFVCTYTQESLWFFYDLPISKQEMAMMRAAIILIGANMAIPPRKELKYAVDTVAEKIVFIECFKMAVEKKSSQQISWILGFFNLLFSTQTDLDYLEDALPTLLTIFESKDILKNKIRGLLLDHPTLKKDKFKSFMEIVETTEPVENIDNFRSRLMVEDLEQLSDKLKSMKI